MKTSTTKAGLLLCALALASVLAATPALADRYDHHGHDRHWHDHGGWRHHYGAYPYSYAQPVYVPPPVYYPPEPSPGVNLFFPINIR